VGLAPATVNAVDRLGETPLHLAARLPTSACLLALLDVPGVDIEAAVRLQIWGSELD
jgi:hypothetical protein